jgi:hypothetical protein
MIARELVDMIAIWHDLNIARACIKQVFEVSGFTSLIELFVISIGGGADKTSKTC